MTIKSLSFQGVRNLASTQIDLSSQINIFYGDNGAGKTSILEAVHLLAMTRSFRLSRTRTVISHDVDQALVSAKLSTGRALVVRRTTSGQVHTRADGDPLKSLSDLVHLIPLQLVYSDSFQLLEGSPGDRRQFLDWGVFHQNKSFNDTWQKLQKCLKNRNSLLRSGRIQRSEMAVWEHEYVVSAEQIDLQRKQYLEGFVPCFHEVLQQLIELPELRIHYYRGWDKTKPLEDMLDAQRDRDLKLGYTQSGPQRADMRVKLGKVNAADELSRGQQKLVICALKIAQSLYLQKQAQQPILFLFDDLPSELDHQHIKKLGTLFERLDCQVLMTCVDPKPLINFWKNPEQIRMFHVEHGEVRLVKEFGDPV